MREMTIRAYMVKTNKKEHGEYKEIIPQLIIGEKILIERDDLLSNMSETDLIDFLLIKGHDYTNDDLCGSIELTIDDWEEIKKQFRNTNAEYSKLTQEMVQKMVYKYKEFFQMIDMIFKMGEADYIEFECK
jgi:hypothetical protein